ncbi:MAG: FIST C-terminal domain-containing protein [Magnetococcales bacterium]|nr:FIST C-terminal domain-containing protein [Magnetococcales bacterium]
MKRMKIKQVTFKQGAFDASLLPPLQHISPSLVFVFAYKRYFFQPAVVSGLLAAFPGAHCVGVSTAGTLSDQGVLDDSCVVTAVRFDRGGVRVATAEVATPEMSWQSGVAVARALPAEELRTVLLFAPGMGVDGSALIAGLTHVLGEKQAIVGGLSGDIGDRQQTLTLSPQGVSATRVVGVGLYGSHLDIRQCSQGGWVPFGPMRKVTRHEGNLLLELDGESALELYNRYLGEYARELPESGLRFPFEMCPSHHATSGLVRTVLNVDRERGGLILGGDIDPTGYFRLMHVTTSKLIGGAEEAAECALSASTRGETGPGLGLLISCVGRKLIMGDQIEDELDVVRDKLGRQHTVAGFYAHGEIGLQGASSVCGLHNQTMTIALITETP